MLDSELIGAKVKGSAFYGKKNTLTGTITQIKEVTFEPQPFYRGKDIISIEWDNGTTARFHRENFHYAEALC